MNNKTKLTAADLALYMGCECKTPTRNGVIDAASLDRVRVESNDGGFILPPEDVWPILRPLSDMTEDEARAVWEKCYGDDFGDGECLLHLTATVDADERNDSEFDIILGYPDAWRYLLSLHFDMFGWIDAGLAIDKTKT